MPSTKTSHSPPTYHESEDPSSPSSSSHALSSHLDVEVQINEHPEDKIPPPSFHADLTPHALFFHRLKDIRYLLPLFLILAIFFAAIPLALKIHDASVILLAVFVLPITAVLTLLTLFSAFLIFFRYPHHSQQFDLKQSDKEYFKSVSTERFNKYTFIFWIIVVCLVVVDLGLFLFTFSVETYRLARGYEDFDDVGLSMISLLLGCGVLVIVTLVSFMVLNRARRFNELARYDHQIQKTELAGSSGYHGKSDS